MSSATRPNTLVISTEGRNLLEEFPQTFVVTCDLALVRFTAPSRMPREKRYYVYIMSSRGRVLYIGVTSFLTVRSLQHKSREQDGFTRHYRVDRLVYYEAFQYVNNAIAREKEIKKWRREKKIALVESLNPAWEDLAADWVRTLGRD